MKLYAAKSILPLFDDKYGIYLSEDGQFDNEVIELINNTQYQFIELERDINFTDIQVVDYQGWMTLSATYTVGKNKSTVLFLEPIMNIYTVLKMVELTTIKKGVIKESINAYFINNEIVFDITHTELVNSLLKEVDEYRQSLIKPIVEEPKTPVNKIKVKKKELPKKEKQQKIKRKKINHLLEPFTIYSKKIIDENGQEQYLYYYIMSVVHIGDTESNDVGGFFKRMKKNDIAKYMWCLNLPIDTMIDHVFSDKEISDMIKNEQYRLELLDESVSLDKVKPFKNGSMTIEEAVDLNNEYLINYMEDEEDKINFSTHKVAFKNINYYALVSLSTQNWLSHADYFLYVINQPAYQAVLRNKNFRGQSIIMHLFEQNEEKIVDILSNWTTKYAKIYKNKPLNDKVLQEESIIDYVAFLAQHIIHLAEKNKLTIYGDEIRPYEFDSRELFYSIQQLAIDTEQSYQYALLRNGQTLGIREPRWNQEGNLTFNVPNNQDYRRITTLYGDLYPEQEYYSQLFGSYYKMREYFANLN